MKKLNYLEMRRVEAGDSSVFRFGDDGFGIFSKEFTFGFQKSGKNLYLRLSIAGKSGVLFCFNNGTLSYGNLGATNNKDLFITPIGFLNRVIKLIK